MPTINTDIDDIEDQNEAQLPTAEKKMARVIGLYGSLDEESSKPIIEELAFYVFEEGQKEIPINFLISTNGGLTSEMFAIYDFMNFAKGLGFTIRTYGIGKVMSAGLLLFSAGSKGERIVGENVRFMIHEISSGVQGPMSHIISEVKESQVAQDSYFSLLRKNTKLKVKDYSAQIKNGENFYFGSQEAIKFGIADKIL